MLSQTVYHPLVICFLRHLNKILLVLVFLCEVTNTHILGFELLLVHFMTLHVKYIIFKQRKYFLVHFRNLP